MARDRGVETRPTDDQLVSRAVAGDTGAFKALVERYAPSVFRMASRAVADHDAASDITQETFIRLWRKLPAYDPRGSFKAWLFRVAVNILRTHMRRAKRRREVMERVVSQELVEALQRKDGPDSLVMVREAREVVAGLLAELPAKYREPFLLKHLEGLSYEEVSSILGVSVGALKVRVHRAREKLAAQMKAKNLVTSGGLDAFSYRKETG